MAKKIPLLTGCLLYLLSLPAQGALSSKSTMPDFTPGGEWINGGPVSSKELLGKVILVYFWCTSSYESINNFSYLEYLDDSLPSANFKIITIHSPEMEFEKKLDNLDLSSKDIGVYFPIFVDSDFAMWNLYRAAKRPSFFLIDAKGNIRETYHSRYEYLKIFTSLQNLIREIPAQVMDEEETEFTFRALTIFESAVPTLKTGYRGLSHFGNHENILVDRDQHFTVPEFLHPDLFYLGGDWKFQENLVKLLREGSSLHIRSTHKVFNLIAGSTLNKPSLAEVRLNGLPLDDSSRGSDIEVKGGKSLVSINTYRLYNLVEVSEPARDLTIQVIFEGDRIEIFGLNSSDLPVQYEIERKQEVKGEEETGEEKVTLSGAELAE